MSQARYFGLASFDKDGLLSGVRGSDNVLGLIAQRLGGESFGTSQEVYKFERIKRAKRAAKAQHSDIELLDFGVGEPDRMADMRVVECLCEQARKPENRFYADNGSPDFCRAVAAFMQATFGVELDPESEILHSMGSKAALSLLSACFMNAGDVVLETNPGYPVFAHHGSHYGAESYAYALHEKNDFLPELESAPAAILKRAKVLLLNYPNNPTGAVATRAFLEEAVAFAKKHHLLIIYDAAYSLLTFSGQKPLSILEIPEARELAVELHSMSKGFNMTGWRLGWVCGNALAIKAYGEMKNYSDSGQFLAIQQAAMKALQTPSIYKSNAKRYERRMDAFIELLGRFGFQPKKPMAGFFLYTTAPKAARKASGESIEFVNAEAFSEWLIRQHLISTVPWDEVGSYVRFSMTFEASDAQESAVLEAFQQRLNSWRFEF